MVRQELAMKRSATLGDIPGKVVTIRLYPREKYDFA